MSEPIPAITLPRLLERYDGLLLDAYGVLVDREGPLPGARELVARLHREHMPFLVLTNSASRLPEAMAEQFCDWGMAIDADQILTSGMLLARHFAQFGLNGQRCLVLGPDNAHEYVRRAGGISVDFNEAPRASVIVFADQASFDLQLGLDAVATAVIGRLDRGEPLHLVVCNPDLVYPLHGEQFGITAGALAAMAEAIIDERYPMLNLRSHRLGKPHPPMFAEALRRIAVKRVVMVGDQLATDIRGAINSGIDSVWLATGLGGGPLPDGGPRPTWRMESLVSRD